MTYAAWGFFVLAALTDWHAVYRENKRLETIAKPATLVALILVALSLGASDTSPGRWLLFALAFGLVGDIANLGDSESRFKMGLGTFLIGHLGYLVCFSELGLPRPGWSWAVFGVLILSMIWTREVTPSTHRQSGLALSAPVVAYTLVIAGMLILAWFTGDWLIAVGAAVFVVSDSVLSMNRFVRPIPHAQLAIMTTYHVGQALIVAGVLGWT
ncbi:putative membrane protein YhhN [Aeromicrobium panaciterrae]|uniref:Membrane protein YhhN n=1 Tax=Aeromicrobium panaciterrae TaxID=363861 RepID=A0ABU1UPY0_9ACTN|nr:lysoplasmalogenase [Aeromicrobium panaciterrae]MDR7087232.1 putative membrane protein YhhN [Aeromicrobium panaciterrae]